MPRRPSLPTLRLHKPSGLAVVTVRLNNGQRKDFYCGPWGSPEAQTEYHRIIAELTASAGRLPGAPTGTALSDLTINELIAAFKKHAEMYYRHPDGSPSSEVDNYRLSLRPVRELYGATLACDFGPLSLKAIQTRMVADGLARPVVNQRIGRVRRMFKWAASEQLIPYRVFQALTTVSGLRRGRCTAREPDPILPVEESVARSILPHVLPPVAAMIELQLLTGMRPGEVCRLRPIDIDRTGLVWLYRPHEHKTAYLGKGRNVALGPRAQAVLLRFSPPADDRYFFSPAEAMAAFRQAQRQACVRFRAPRPSKKRKQTPLRVFAPRYNAKSYAKAVSMGCKKASVQHFHPNQLRHTLATEVRRRFGLEAAQVLLGHSRADVTQVYAERDEGLAIRIAAEVG